WTRSSASTIPPCKSSTARPANTTSTTAHRTVIEARPPGVQGRRAPGFAILPRLPQRPEPAMLNEIKKDAQMRMGKSIDSLRDAMTKVRTGRASTSLVDHLKVNYYGSEMPLGQVASIAINDARSLTITPWEKPMVAAVEKAIINSDLGLTPNTAGTVIRINLPALTEERRRDLS